MDPMTAGIAGGASSAFGAWMNSKSQKKTNEMNQAIAREQMAFQERMSNSAHQRETKDLEAAGLNRILGVSGSGASAPSGASSTAIAPQTGNILRDSVNSGLSSANLESDLAIKDVSVAKTAAETVNTIMGRPGIEADNELKGITSARSRATFEADVEKAKAASKREKHSAGRESIAEKVEKADAPRATQQSEIDKDYGKYDAVVRRIMSTVDAITSGLNVGKYLRPPTVKPGTPAEKRALEKAGRKGLPVRP